MRINLRAAFTLFKYCECLKFCLNALKESLIIFSLKLINWIMHCTTCMLKAVSATRWTGWAVIWFVDYGPCSEEWELRYVPGSAAHCFRAEPGSSLWWCHDVPRECGFEEEILFWKIYIYLYVYFYILNGFLGPEGFGCWGWRVERTECPRLYFPTRVTEGANPYYMQFPDDCIYLHSYGCSCIAYDC